jgi:parvulin-like peptidyl-prolyl isomerase
MGFMIRLPVLSAVVLLGLADAGAGQEKEVLLDGVAAVVNEHVITVGDIMAAVEPLRQRLSAAATPDERRKELAALCQGALDSIIEKFLILDSEESKKTEIPDWYVDRRVEDIVKESFGGDRTRFMNVLARDRQSFEQWRSELKDHITVSSVRSMKIDQKINVSPVEMHEFYEKEKARFVVPGRIKVSMIVLDKAGKADDQVAVAELLKKRILGGEDFGGLARKYSSGTYAENGGDWGWIEPSILRADLRDASESMAVGDIGIVDGGSEVYVFRVEARKDEASRAYEDVEPMVERELRKQKAAEEVKAWIGLLKKGAYIKINEINLE